MPFTNAIMNVIFGKVRYRVKFIYTIGNAEIFSFHQTVILSEPRLIDKGRELKKCYGNLNKKLPEIKHLLKNGIFSVEPICSLGRWK